MYFEQIGKITADHLRTHIKDYLEEVNGAFTAGDRILLTNPQSIEVASEVSGLLDEFLAALPAYTVDVLTKDLFQADEDLNTYQYVGHIAGLVSSQSQQSVDKLVKRHAAACELFLKRHTWAGQSTGYPFTILNTLFGNATLSGAEKIDEVGDRDIWLASFVLNLIWIVSEDSWAQHG